MEWLRLYCDVLEDRRFHQMPAELYRRWTFLLILARRNGGIMPPLDDVAFSLRCSEADATDTLTALTGYGLIDHCDDDHLAPHNWSKRQFESDTSTPRVRRFREKHAQRGGNVSETLHETPPEQNRLRTDTDTEQTRESPPTPPLAEPAKPPEPSPAATPRTPPDLRKPTEKERGWIERHPLWPAVTEIFGRPASSQWSSVAASLRDLDELGATDDEVRRRADIYPAVMGTSGDGTPILMTLRALVKHWSACARAPTPTPAKPSRWSSANVDLGLAAERLQAAMNGGRPHAEPDSIAAGTGIVPHRVAASVRGSGDG